MGLQKNDKYQKEIKTYDSLEEMWGDDEAAHEKLVFKINAIHTILDQLTSTIKTLQHSNADDLVLDYVIKEKIKLSEKFNKLAGTNL